MPVRDLHHEALKKALVKSGWVITHDPYRMSWGRKDLYVDLGAERILTAERAGRKIAVELKTFGGPSDMDSLKNALGQYLVYRSVMSRVEP